VTTRHQALTPRTVEEPTDKAALRIEASHGESHVDVLMEVRPEDGSGLASMFAGIGGAVAVAVGGPAITLWAAHAASIAPDWACGLAVTQVILAGFMAKSYRHRPTK
jgi:hypothetical protein